MDAVSLRFKTPELDAARRVACDEVLKHFSLPQYELLCFFDDENPREFLDLGPSYCGFHAVIAKGGLGWPRYIWNLFHDRSGRVTFQNVIYINGRTCSTTPGTVITLAHELQHFVQYGFAHKVWLANTLIYDILRDGPPTTIEAWDIPYERDTTRVSKQVAVHMLGKEAVEAYADAQISAGSDPGKWRAFLRTSNSTP